MRIRVHLRVLIALLGVAILVVLVVRRTVAIAQGQGSPGAFDVVLGIAFLWFVGRWGIVFVLRQRAFATIRRQRRRIVERAPGAFVFESWFSREAMDALQPFQACDMSVLHLRGEHLALAVSVTPSSLILWAGVPTPLRVLTIPSRAVHLVECAVEDVLLPLREKPDPSLMLHLHFQWDGEPAQLSFPLMTPAPWWTLPSQRDADRFKQRVVDALF